MITQFSVVVYRYSINNKLFLENYLKLLDTDDDSNHLCLELQLCKFWAVKDEKHVLKKDWVIIIILSMMHRIE